MTFFDFFKAGFYDFFFLNIFGHFLFIIALSGVYTLSGWRTVYSFIACFIAGYLITFSLDWAGLITIPENLQRVLIPVTIIVTSFTNFFVKKKVFTNRYPSQDFRYFLAIAAGLIHGFSFANDRAGRAIADAIGYNFGIITCIILSGFFLLLTAFFLTYFLRVKLREWNLIVSGAAAGIAIFKLFLSLY